MEKIDTTSGIYCFENLVNGKKYIGQAVDINRRFKRHLFELRQGKSPNKIMQSAWDKYGEENFIFYIIEECSREELDEKEIFYIEILGSHCRKNGYNISFGGKAPMKGIEVTEEHRKNLSIAKSGENHPMYGKKLSKETLAKMSLSLRGRKQSDEQKFKSAMTQTGVAKGRRKGLYMGVRKDNCDCFIVRINNAFTKNREYLGYYRDEIEAAKVYDKRSWELYHNLLKLNIPSDYIDMT